MFLSSIIAPWIDLSIKAGHLAYETQALVGLRLFRMATGTVPLVAGPQRVIPEKVAAFPAVRGADGAVSDRTARNAVTRSRGRVKANKDRRSKSPRISRH